MSPTRVLVVDDEAPARAGARLLLARHADFQVIGECSGGAEAVEAVGRDAPDLVLLDVQMPEVDGFEVVRRVGPQHMPALIFFTAYDAHAVRAFEVNAIDYLLKPSSVERFDAALERVRRSRRSEQAAAWRDRLSALVGELEPDRAGAAAAVPRHAARLTARLGARWLVVPVVQIDWIEADGYCCTVHAAGKSYVMRDSLRALAATLDPEVFVRAHRSAIVNVERVREVREQPTGELELLLDGGERLPVSRRRRADLERLLGRLR